MSDSGARFRCVLSNALGVATSQEATLTVTPDVTPPGIAAIQNIGSSALVVTFTEAMETASASNPANYTLDNGAAVSGVSPGADGLSVTLATSPLTFGTTYTLRVSGAKKDDLQAAMALLRQSAGALPIGFKNFRD